MSLRYVKMFKFTDTETEIKQKWYIFAHIPD